MGVDQTSLDRIRNATFPSSKRGYDKQEVEKFLSRLADWLETGGDDESRSETVKRELERVGERTGAILSQAEDSAQQIRAEAEEYSEETRNSADAYAEQTRAQADVDAENAREQARQDVADAVPDAEAKAQRIVEEGVRRREDIEAVISDLARHRDDVLADTEELTSKLTAAVSEHRPAGSDPFDKPEELDPLAEDEGSEDLAFDEDDVEEEAEEAEDVEDAEDVEETEDVEAEAESGDTSVTQEAPATKRSSRARA